MRIGISLLTLVPGVVGGSETYARALTRTLAQVGELEYEAFVPAIAADAADGLPTTVVPEYRAGRSFGGRIFAMSLATARPGPIARRFRAAGLDAIHFPLSVMLPPVSRPPAATTIHDLQHEEFPQFFSRAELAYRRVVYGWTVRRSRIVIALSEHAAETLRQRYRLAPDRVRVIPHGIDRERFRPDPSVAREPFLLYPANRWPHKNHGRLFAAFALLRRERPELRLVLTGRGHDSPLPDGVELRGHVSLDELASLYRRACALVFPSLYEGFGQPPLEAMASSCPVAVSRAGPLPEVCGDAAEYFDPLDAEEMAAAIVRALKGEHVEAGLARAAQFTWEESARRHDAVYRELASGA